MSKMPGKKKKYNARFPPARIKKIMQTDEEVGKVAAAVPVIISRALELFAELLLNQANDVTLRRGARTLTPSHLKFCIENEKKFDFLKEMVSNVPELQDDDLEMEGDVTPVQPSKPRSKSSATTNGRSENDESMFKEPIYQISENDSVSPHVPSSVTSPMTANTPPILSSMTATTTPVTGGHSPAMSRGQPPHLTPLSSSSKSQSTTASTPGTSPAAASTRTGAPPKRRGRPPKTNGSVGRGYPPMPGEKRKHSESHGEKRKHSESHGEKRKHPESHGEKRKHPESLGEKRKHSDSFNSEQKRKHRDKNDETDGVIFLGQSASSTSEDSGASPGCLNSRVGQPGTPSGQPASTSESSSSSPLPASFILSHNLPALPSRTNGDAAAQARNKFILPSSSKVTAKETKSPSVFSPTTSASPSSHLFSRQGSALEGRKEKCSTSLLKSKNKKSGLARSNSTTPVMARSNSTPVIMYTMSPLEDGGDTGSPLPGTAAGVGASPLAHHHTTPKSRPPSFTINLPGQGDSTSTPSISMDLDPTSMAMAAPLSAPVLPSKNSRNPIGDFRGHHHSPLVDNMTHKSDNNFTSNHRSKSGKSEVVLYPRNNFQVGRGVDSDKSSMTNQILNLSSRRHSGDDKSSSSSHQRPFIHSVVGSSLSRQISESGISSSNCELSRHNAVDQSVSNRVTFSRFKPVDEDYDC